MSQQPV